MLAMVESAPVGDTRREAQVESRGALRTAVDPAVLAAARSGDRRAFVTVLRHHDRLLRLVAWQVLGDRDLMDDVLQEVALKAWLALPGFRGEAAVGTWLSRLAFNAAVDLLRRRPRDQPVDTSTGSQTPVWADHASGADPADHVGGGASLRAAFAALPAGQRLTVMLIDREGYDYDTVAGILGVRPGTVASRLNRARVALRAALTPPATMTREDTR